MTSISSAIYATCAYADIFNYPLTLAEIHRYLIHNTSVSYQTTQDVIRDLIKNNRLTTTHHYYHLPNRHSIVAVRRQRSRISMLKLQQARKIAGLLSPLPSIQAIVLTGDLSLQNAHQDADIDLFIITNTHTLWLTRPLIHLFLSFTGLRRSPHSKVVSNLACTNLFLDLTSLSIPPNKQNLYTAHELAQARPLFSRHQTYARLMQSNRWLLQYLPHTPIPTQELPPLSSTSFFLKNLNSLAFQAQHAYMRPRLTKETITLHSAFFHPNTRLSDIQTELSIRSGYIPNT